MHACRLHVVKGTDHSWAAQGGLKTSYVVTFPGATCIDTLPTPLNHVEGEPPCTRFSLHKKITRTTESQFLPECEEPLMHR
jgi:hypothetical protein